VSEAHAENLGPHEVEHRDPECSVAYRQAGDEEPDHVAGGAGQDSRALQHKERRARNTSSATKRRTVVSRARAPTRAACLQRLPKRC